MANREALRDLQTRLANRLQAARTEGVTSSWLAVESGSVRYLFPLNQSGEIFPWAGTLAVPYSQNWFMGVSNLRGGLFGVVDLASYISGQPAAQRTETSRTEARLVALNPLLEVNCALLIDRLAGLRNAEAFSSSMEPPENSPAFFGHTFVDLQGASWQEINLQILSQQPSFLSISA